MFRFLHAADIHLDSPLRGLERYEGAPVEELRGATRRAFTNLVELAVEESVAFVLLAGDLYDGDWRDYNTGLFFTAQMARLKQAGIAVFVIAGNHDAASKLTRRLRPPDNVHLFATDAAESRAIESLGVMVHGQGFAQAAVREDRSLAYPPARPGGFNIGLLHTSLDGRPGHEPYAPCSLAGLRSRGYQYWALGHVHAREVVCEDPWVVFPGNLQGRHARETGAKGATLVTVQDGAVSTARHCPLDVVRWVDRSIDVTDATRPDDLADIAAQAMAVAVGEGEGRLVALRLRLTGRSELHATLHADGERIVSELRSRAVELGADALWLEKVVIETHAPPAAGADDAEEDPGRLLAALTQPAAREECLQRLRDDPLLLTLRTKLPAALLGAEDAFDPLLGGVLESALDDAGALLRQRLLAGCDRA